MTAAMMLLAITGRKRARPSPKRTTPSLPAIDLGETQGNWKRYTNRPVTKQARSSCPECGNSRNCLSYRNETGGDASRLAPAPHFGHDLPRPRGFALGNGIFLWQDRIQRDDGFRGRGVSAPLSCHRAFAHISSALAAVSRSRTPVASGCLRDRHPGAVPDSIRGAASDYRLACLAD